VEAFKEALREQPESQDAKHNLELALREAQKQKMGGQGSPPGSRGRQKQNQQPSNQQGPGNPQQKQQEKGNQSPDSQQKARPRQGQGEQGQPQKPGEGQDDRLPQFRNQPDMNAREAASVLSAVENLERQQRREQAAKRARQHAARGKDW
jgi:Ca-activated chloride channel family protein